MNTPFRLAAVLLFVAVPVVAWGVEPTHGDVAYGEHPRHRLDFYQASSDEPTPLIVHIHGGGFVGGNKRSVSAAMVRGADAKGISVAALNYRFVDGDEVIFPAPQHDCARAIQFLRGKAGEETKAVYDEASAITHLTGDDPPLYMIYSEPDIVPPDDAKPGEFIHHPNFGKQLRKAMDDLGIENVYVHTDDADGRDLQREMLEFFVKQFEAAE